MTDNDNLLKQDLQYPGQDPMVNIYTDKTHKNYYLSDKI